MSTQGGFDQGDGLMTVKGQRWDLHIMADLLLGNGNMRKIEPRDKNQGFTWNEIRSLLGEFVRLVPLDEIRILLVQEYPSRQTINATATAMVATSLRTRRPPADQAPIICGRVLIARFTELRVAQILAHVGLVF